jgi:hypothetical protein
MDGDFSADAITHCIKTTNNELSVWEIPSEKSLDDAVLAIITGPKVASIETIDVVTLEPDYLHQSGIGYDKSPGQTFVDDLKGTHYDLKSMTYTKLGIVAGHISDGIQKERVARYTVGRQKEVLRNAINSGRLIASTLNENIQAKLQT